MRALITAIVGIIVGAGGLYAVLRAMGRKRALKTMDLILVLVFTILVAFTVTMIVLFTRYGQTPDTLITCVFGALAGECGIMGWIKTSKVRHEDRQWMKEDREEARKDGGQFD